MNRRTVMAVCAGWFFGSAGWVSDLGLALTLACVGGLILCARYLLLRAGDSDD